MGGPRPVGRRIGSPPPRAEVMGAVDQAGDGTATGGVVVAAVPVGARQALEARHLANAMLDGDALAGEGLVVGHILRRARLTARLAARGQAARVQFGQARIGQVAAHGTVGRLAPPLARRFYRREAGVGAGPSGLHVDDVSALRVHPDLQLQRGHLLLARVVAVRLRALTGALAALLQAVDDQSLRRCR